MFEQFTNEARTILRRARERAMGLDGPDWTIETSHLLLALIEKGGRGVDILRRLDVDPAVVKREIVLQLSDAFLDAATDFRFSDQAKQALEIAVAAARSSGAPAAGSEHLLVGLIESDGIASQILRLCGATPEAVRAYSRTVGDQPPDETEEHPDPTYAVDPHPAACSCCHPLPCSSDPSAWVWCPHCRHVVHCRASGEPDHCHSVIVSPEL